MADDPKSVMAWLEAKPDLVAMRGRFPDEWSRVETEMAAALTERSTRRLDELLMRGSRISAPGAPHLEPVGRKARMALATQLVRRRMAALALENYSIAAATGGPKGGAPIGRRTRGITSGLFQDRDGTKRPVSLWLFRLFWPLVPDKAAYLTRMQAKGTYCFFSDKLVTSLASLIGNRRCLEIAAGDGTLSRFLAADGTDIVATDDMSWRHEIAYPASVQQMDAGAALRRFEPEVVLCSWPPPGNTFERHVFATPSVQLYVVIGSRHDFATGARSEYEHAAGFSMRTDVALSRLVLPPEAANELIVFERTNAPAVVTSTLARPDTIP